ncbi:MAG TPA: helix-turn-helix domain-containing protein [Nitrospiraceae bacterium]|nr:helix-turn-helix domain-containing protein [Nitrospiraceae bacterium]
MPIGSNISAWRVWRHRSTAALAAQANLPLESLEAIESGEVDPSAAVLEQVASALGVPPSWLFGDPKHLDLLLTDGDEEAAPLPSTIDPVTEQVLLASRHARDLYVLLTVLIQSGEPKLLRAAEVSLRSLVKQSKQATVPWQSRPPGHFEPPAD